ncbi:MAG: ORF6N domain-containing protein [Candidatus Saganbacteria bacterium]|nr:ORF6N domain-containing protein [Candidatus Saganbacteria bacterium]
MPIERIENKIFVIRKHKIMIDRDLAELYQVSTKALNQAVKRNKNRFPKEFMFRLAKEEKNELVTNCDRLAMLKHSSVLPYVFTEHGVAMLSSVLNSKRAIKINILIMKTFIKLRELISSHKDILQKIDSLEKKYDGQFRLVFDAIRNLMLPPEKSKRKIGFLRGDRNE